MRKQCPVRGALTSLIDFNHVGDGGTRPTVGAVNANSGAMNYFDSRAERLAVQRVMASGALPPAALRRRHVGATELQPGR